MTTHELIYRRSWPTRTEARRAIFEFIEVFYNPQRLHSSLGYLSPTEYEAQKEAQPDLGQAGARKFRGCWNAIPPAA